MLPYYLKCRKKKQKKNQKVKTHNLQKQKTEE